MSASPRTCRLSSTRSLNFAASRADASSPYCSVKRVPPDVRDEEGADRCVRYVSQAAYECTPCKSEPQRADSVGQDGKHLLGMTVGLHVGHRLRDGALGVDDEGRALDPEVLPAPEVLLAPGAVGLGYLMLGIGE